MEPTPAQVPAAKVEELLPAFFVQEDCRVGHLPVAAGPTLRMSTMEHPRPLDISPLVGS